MICPNCEREKNREIKMNLDGNFFECPQCKFAIRNEEDKEWYKEICDNDYYWEKRVFKEFPAVIAHEYFRIYDLLKNGQTYGAIFQIKDLFEVIIKLPVLIYASKILSKEEKSNEEYKILFSILKKPLSLGDWKGILNEIYKLIENNEFLYLMIKKVKELYDNPKFDIVKWRNETIGHGALSFDSNINFISEVKFALVSIKKVFTELIDIYLKIHLFVYENENEIYFIGKNQAKDLLFQYKSVYVKVADESIQKISPFILIDDNQLFFFDSFIDKKCKYDMLSYPLGVKKSYSNEYMAKDIEKIFKQCVSILGREEKGIILKSSVEDDIYLISSEQQLMNYQLENNFEKVPYLENWIKDNINNNKKGVFWLQMERGMGKSTFVQMIDKKAIGNVKIANTTSKVLYLNDTYNSDIQFIFQKLVNLLNHDDDNKLIFIEKYGWNFNFDSKDRKNEFAQLLNKYRKIYRERCSENKLLIILDGLDEVNINLYNNICDFIPLDSMLEDGVYILITSRTSEEIKSLNNINKNINNKLIVERNSREYIEVLTKYLKRYFVNCKDSVIQEILKKSDNRFFYVNIFVSIKKHFDDIDLSLFSEEKEIIKMYIERLCFQYGKKYSQKLIKILYILATIKEQLNLKEISYLLGSEKITFEILGYMSDLKSILRIERTLSRGNVYSLSNILAREIVLDNYNGIKFELSNEWITKLQFLRNYDDNLTNDGITYLISNLLEYNFILENNQFEKICTGDFFMMIQEVIGRLRLEHNGYKIERQIKMLEVLNKLLNKSKIDSYLKAFIYTYLYKESAEILYQEARISTEKVIGLLNKSIESAEKIVESEFKKEIVNIIYENKIQIAGLSKSKYDRKSKLSCIEKEVINESIDIPILTKCMLYRELTNAHIEDKNYEIPLKYAEIQKKYYGELISSAKTLLEEHDYKASLLRVEGCIVNIYVRNNIHNDKKFLELQETLISIETEAKKLQSVNLDNDIIERINTEISYSTYLTKLLAVSFLNKNDYESAFKSFNKVLEIYSYLDKIDYKYDNTHRIESYLALGNMAFSNPELTLLNSEYKDSIDYYNEIILFYQRDETGFKSDPNEEFFIIFKTYIGIIKYYFQKTDYKNATDNLKKLINLKIVSKIEIDEYSLIDFLRLIHSLVNLIENNQLSCNFNKAHIYYLMNSKNNSINIKTLFTILKKDLY